MRPSDLAREHGLSAQAVRNYERDGFLPPAARTAAGYRVYTRLHAAALRAHLALVAAYGHATAAEVMTAVHADRLDEALTALGRGQARLLRDRETLAAVRQAVDDLTAAPAPARLREDRSPRSIGEVAHHLGVTPATLRTWESAGVLTPARDRTTGHRVYLAPDLRDAELAHLLRRGHYPLPRIAAVLHQIRGAGGTAHLAAALTGWQHRLTTQGIAMLRADGLLGGYLALREEEFGPGAPGTPP
ncbi:MerR family DNA-binding transcriptional regulator [Kitasatospora sp. NPDC101183]|uniref:MerR family DNA-binding transcriptional regulator n=1 Tax=Kitasatospora sp. NPDC101183 TaxID=3364100 RepID=UPI00382D2B25